MLNQKSSLTRRGALAACAGAGALGITGCGQGREILYAADAQIDGYPTVEAVRFMAARLEELTGGRLKMNIYPGAQLGAEKDTLEITIFGGLDLNRVNIAPLNSIARETFIPALPFLFKSIPHARAAMDGAPGQAILDALEPHGLIGLCYYDSGARSFYNARRPIHEPDDMKGLKIRVQNSDLYVSLVEALGANATPMPYGEIYTGITQGVIDGAENNWPSYFTSRHFEVARYYTLNQHVLAPEVLVMSAHRWNRLNDDDKQAVRQAARESVPFMRSLWDALVDEARETVVASGVEVVEDVDKSLFAARMAPVWDRFISTPKMQSIVDDILSMEEAGA
ncbi:TRAP transporter substrate-binding protein [Aquisalinus flavus]|uniref:C4-dicarboxylate ABC transporter n=1 Tax=Aquisalinus flavus TaxID=1526572 RepID=A0A8J2V264_9PROT|nr:TRAP transporter substrate-binding protein [Aquisalinus flavus]GGC98783.1 C4-dicarboxylate ABC transporter [Aquisalinus flavus]